MNLFSLENLLKCHSWSASSACELPHITFHQQIVPAAPLTCDNLAVLSNILTAPQKETLHMLNGDMVTTGKKQVLSSQSQG
jgi:hypothetical protein